MGEGESENRVTSFMDDPKGLWIDVFRMSPMDCSIYQHANMALQRMPLILTSTKAIHFIWINLNLDQLIRIRICTKVIWASIQFLELFSMPKFATRSMCCWVHSVDQLKKDFLLAWSKFFLLLSLIQGSSIYDVTQFWTVFDHINTLLRP